MPPPPRSAAAASAGADKGGFPSPPRRCPPREQGAVRQGRAPAEARLQLPLRGAVPRLGFSSLFRRHPLVLRKSSSRPRQDTASPPFHPSAAPQAGSPGGRASHWRDANASASDYGAFHRGGPGAAPPRGSSARGPSYSGYEYSYGGGGSYRCQQSPRPSWTAAGGSGASTSGWRAAGSGRRAGGGGASPFYADWDDSGSDGDEEFASFYSRSSYGQGTTPPGGGGRKGEQQQQQRAGGGYSGAYGGSGRASYAGR